MNHSLAPPFYMIQYNNQEYLQMSGRMSVCLTMLTSHSYNNYIYDYLHSPITTCGLQASPSPYPVSSLCHHYHIYTVSLLVHCHGIEILCQYICLSACVCMFILYVCMYMCMCCCLSLKPANSFFKTKVCNTCTEECVLAARVRTPMGFYYT